MRTPKESMSRLNAYEPKTKWRFLAVSTADYPRSLSACTESQLASSSGCIIFPEYMISVNTRRWKGNGKQGTRKRRGSFANTLTRKFRNARRARCVPESSPTVSIQTSSHCSFSILWHGKPLIFRNTPSPRTLVKAEADLHEAAELRIFSCLILALGST